MDLMNLPFDLREAFLLALNTDRNLLFDARAVKDFAPDGAANRRAEAKRRRKREENG